MKSFLGFKKDSSDYRDFTLFGPVSPLFKDNEVKTSRYNVFTFLPLNLFLQFTKPANIYFLFIGILQVIPSISLSGAIPTIAIPLTIVVVANMIKDGIEDRKRHVSDDKENSQIIKVVDHTSGALIQRKWKELKVGDVVVVYNNGPCPADIVLLATSELSGVSFVETANLDGETNLKLKSVPRGLEYLGASGDVSAEAATMKICSDLKSADFHCQLPNNSLYQFEGSIGLQSWSDVESGLGRVALSSLNVVLRGCRLRNTEWVLGAVVYTGHETKIQMNSRPAPRKMSQFEHLTNKFIFISFVIQMILCFVGALVWGLIVSSSTYQSELYLGISGISSSEAAGKSVLKFFSYMILFSNFIPISLMVTLALVKLFQSQLIQMDEYMKACTVVRTSDLNEELGQIEYVFTDKTGTLTMNKMEFRKACVSGISYGQGLTEIRKNVLRKMGEFVPPDAPIPDGAKVTRSVNFFDSKLDIVMSSKQPTDHYNDLVMFFFSLAVNHSVMIEAGDVEGAYAAASPDEGALTYGAKHFGFTFLERTPKGVSVQIPGGATIVVEQLASFDFTSDRKRSSLVCRCVDPRQGAIGNEKYFLFIKGADTVLLPRLSAQSLARRETKQMVEEMENFALDGLRTLCIGFREVGGDEIKTWLPRHAQACISMSNREEQLEALANEIETQIEMLGVTAIEDKLQEDVGGTIDRLRNAGIKVWMLTGDKLETAINIGLATSLLNTSGMHRVILSRMGSDMKEALRRTKAEFDQVLALSSAVGDVGVSVIPEEAVGTSEVALIVQGADLELIYVNEELKNNFAEIVSICASVICCRVSPEQKGAVVRLIREKYNKVTLAVGDGANDCNMIQSANVGVGIKGVEGMQAFNSSDYGITEFRFLGPLMLIHGRWAYRRIAKLVLYVFYKNVVIVLPSYFLNIVVGLFSGQRLFEEYLYQLFNVFFTAAPVIIYGIFERDISKQDCLDFPQLYRVGPGRVHAKRRTFVQWLLTGLWHSVCVFFIPYLCMTGTRIYDSDGIPSDIWLFGIYVYLSIVLVVNLKLLLEAYFLNGLLIAVTIGSTLLWFLCLYVLEIVPNLSYTSVNLSPQLPGISSRLYSSPMTFFILFATCATALVRDFIFKAFRFRFRHRDYHLVMASLIKAPVKTPPTDRKVEIQRMRSQTHDLSVFTETDPLSTWVMASVSTGKQTSPKSPFSI